MSEEKRAPEVEELGAKVSELEKLADALGDASDEEVVGMLDRTVGLLKDINTRIEAGLGSAREEEREIGEILEGMDFGPFDEALEDLERRDERREQPPGDAGS